MTEPTLTDVKLAELFHGSTLDDLLAEPAGTLRISQYGIEVYLDTFQWLRNRLTYDPILDAEFQEYNDAHPDEYDYTNMQNWLDSKGFTHRGDNTYNGDNALYHDFQYEIFRADSWDDHVIIQLHLGGDIRGNYSFPMVFELDDPDYFYDHNRVSMTNGKDWFDSDNGGYNFYDTNCNTVGFDFRPLEELYTCDLAQAEAELETYSWRMLDAGLDPNPQLKLGREKIGKIIPEAIELTKDNTCTPEGRIIIWYDGEGNGYLEGRKLVALAPTC